MQQTEPKRQACHWTGGIPGRNQSIPNHIVQAKKIKNVAKALDCQQRRTGIISESLGQPKEGGNVCVWEGGIGRGGGGGERAGGERHGEWSFRVDSSEELSGHRDCLNSDFIQSPARLSLCLPQTALGLKVLIKTAQPFH